MANRIIADFFGTALTAIKIGITSTAVRLKNVAGVLRIRNAGDSADANLVAGKLSASGDDIELNEDAAGSGADWLYTLRRPSSGMTGAVVLTLPVDDGTSGQVLQTDGSGALSWASAGTTADCIKVDSTTVAFGASSPVTMFTKEANAASLICRVVVDTAFDGTAPTLSIGIAGSTSKYVPATAIDLKTTGIYEFDMSAVAIEAGTESLIATYSADGSAAGSARILFARAVPT